MRKILRDLDPEGLIKGGAPKDEYDLEADKITAAFAIEDPHDDLDVFYVVWPIFKHWLHYKEDNERAKARYVLISMKIFDKLHVKSETRTFKK